jgi:dihydroneopterin aldolase
VDRILISGMREFGIHGVLPEEQERPQPFEIDVELFVDLSVPGHSDDLTETVDYGLVRAEITKVVTTEHYQLLERLAARIAEVCRRDVRVQGVVVEVRKMEPPIDADLAFVGVRIER